MIRAKAEEQAVKTASFNGIDIYRINTEKFKTSSINFFFIDNLSRETATKNALLPAVMRRGSTKHPTFKDISMELENLYGASFDCGVTKKGEAHVIQFYIEFLSQRYIPDGTDSFSAAFDMIFNIITEPNFTDGRFNESYLAQEKDNLRKRIESRVNDKMTYSMEKCLEEMCREEPYGIYDYGMVEDIEPISSEELTMHHRTMLETYPLQVYLAGDIDDAQVETVIKRLSQLKRRQVNKIHAGFLEKSVDRVKELTERMNVTQGKLCLGFRTNIAADNSFYPSLMVLNGILGGGVHSKLFQNVREKASLCYYVFSRLEKFKGLMVVSGGIDFKNRDKALDIILKQVEDIKNGVISQEELTATVKNMETSLKSLRDSQINIVDYYLSHTISGTSDTFEELIEKLKAVAVDDIVKAASKIYLDTIYFLAASDSE